MKKTTATMTNIFNSKQQLNDSKWKWKKHFYVKIERTMICQWLCWKMTLSIVPSFYSIILQKWPKFEVNLYFFTKLTWTQYCVKEKKEIKIVRSFGEFCVVYFSLLFLYLFRIEQLQLCNVDHQFFFCFVLTK